MDKRYSHPTKKITSIFPLLFLSLLLSFNSSSAQDGEKLFKQNCAVCHSLGTNKLTGPGLAGVAQRVPGDAWLMKWIKNNTAVIKSGDAYANKILTENGGAQMTVFADLPDADIKALIGYIKNPPKPKEVVAAPTAGGEQKQEEQERIAKLKKEYKLKMIREYSWIAAAFVAAIIFTIGNLWALQELVELDRLRRWKY